MTPDLTPDELSLLRQAGTTWGCRDARTHDPALRRLLALWLVSFETERWIVRTTVAGRDVLLAARAAS